MAVGDSKQRERSDEPTDQPVDQPPSDSGSEVGSLALEQQAVARAHQNADGQMDGQAKRGRRSAGYRGNLFPRARGNQDKRVECTSGNARDRAPLDQSNE